MYLGRPRIHPEFACVAGTEGLFFPADSIPNEVKGFIMEKEMTGICGAYCGVCEWKEKTNCPGCQACQSKVFWGVCSIAKCAIGKGYKHCGLCPALPCEELVKYFSNPEHGDNGERLANLKMWAKGKNTYLKLTPLKAGKNP